MPETSDKKDHFVGVDLGGTKILAGVFNSQLECLGRARVSTKAQRGADEVIERIIRSVKDVVDKDAGKRRRLARRLVFPTGKLI